MNQQSKKTHPVEDTCQSTTGTPADRSQEANSVHDTNAEVHHGEQSEQPSNGLRKLLQRFGILPVIFWSLLVVVVAVAVLALPRLFIQSPGPTPPTPPTSTTVTPPIISTNQGRLEISVPITSTITPTLETVVSLSITTITVTPTPTATPETVLVGTDMEIVRGSMRGNDITLTPEAFSTYYAGTPQAFQTMQAINPEFGQIITTQQKYTLESHDNRPDSVTFDMKDALKGKKVNRVLLLMSASNTTSDHTGQSIAEVRVSYELYDKVQELKLGTEIADRTGGECDNSNIVFDDPTTRGGKTHLYTIPLELADNDDPIQKISIEDISVRTLNDPKPSLNIAGIQVAAFQAPPDSSPSPTQDTSEPASPTTTMIPICLTVSDDQGISATSIADIISPSATITRNQNCEIVTNNYLGPAEKTPVPFIFYDAIVTEPTETSRYGSTITINVEDKELSQVRNIYVLMAARNMCVDQDTENLVKQGYPIGRIVAHFEDGYSTPVYPLKAGKNIRQSRTDDSDECGDKDNLLFLTDKEGYATSGFHVEENSYNPPAKDSDKYLFFDFYTITILSDELRDRKLVSIDIIDDSVQKRTGDQLPGELKDPFISLYGITIETEARTETE